MAALLMITHTFWADLVGMFLTIFWCSLFSAMFLVAQRDPTASATAFIPYAVLTAVTAALLTQRLIDRNNERV